MQFPSQFFTVRIKGEFNDLFSGWERSESKNGKKIIHHTTENMTQYHGKMENLWGENERFMEEKQI